MKGSVLSPEPSALVMTRLQEESAGAIRLARAMTAELAASAGQRELLLRPFRDLEASPLLADSSPHLAETVTLPLLVHACATGDPTPAIPLAAVVALAQFGVDLLDALMDGDDHGWGEVDGSVLMLAGATLLAAAAPLALRRLGLAPTLTARLHALFCEGLLVMSAGQQADLEGRDSCPSPEAALRTTADKSGAFTAMLTEAAATLAGVSAPRARRWGAVGAAWGTAGQVRSDMRDVLRDDGRDLVAGTRTLPVALWLSGVPDEERPAALALLGRARSDARARAEVRAAIVSSGVLRDCGIVVALHCGEATRALAATRPVDPWASHLAWLISRTAE